MSMMRRVGHDRTTLATTITTPLHPFDPSIDPSINQSIHPPSPTPPFLLLRPDIAAASGFEAAARIAHSTPARQPRTILVEPGLGTPAPLNVTFDSVFSTPNSSSCQPLPFGTPFHTTLVHSRETRPPAHQRRAHPSAPLLLLSLPDHYRTYTLPLPLPFSVFLPPSLSHASTTYPPTHHGTTNHVVLEGLLAHNDFV